MHRYIFLIIPLLLLASLHCGSDDDDDATPPPEDALELTLHADEPAAEVNPRFLSYAVDTVQVVNGIETLPNWDPIDGAPPIVDGEPYDFTRPKLRRLAEELRPNYLRIGGTNADIAYYDMSDDPPDEAPAPYVDVWPRSRWDALADFAAAMDAPLIFTLNIGPGPRDAEDNWDPANARRLLDHVTARGDEVALWEAGNEPNGFFIEHDGFRRSPEELVADYTAVKALLNEYYDAPLLGGTSSAFWPTAGEMGAVYEETMAAGAGDPLDVVTWHYYPTQSERCPFATVRSTPTTLLDPTALDEMHTWANHVEAARDAHAPDLPIWLGETGNAQCGGQPGVSDSWAGSLWWLDELGLLARCGHEVVVRQVLSGFDYGLIDDATLTPNPDYWVSVLWKRLMGTRVLDIDSSSPTLRTYAHCRADGSGIVIAAVNLEQTQSQVLSIPLRSASQAWVLTATGLDARTVMLNGETIREDETGAPPALDPVETQTTATPWLELPPLSIAFFALPEADAPACE